MPSSLPPTPPDLDAPHVRVSGDDLALLDALTNPGPPAPSWRRRDAPLDPLLYAAAVASGPHITKNHYHHDFFPADPDAPRDWSQWAGPLRPAYASKQAPRSLRLAEQRLQEEQRQHEHAAAAAAAAPLPAAVNASPPPFDAARAAPQVQCLARARIPTPHGAAFLHLYRNNRDAKEHLALVLGPAIRSRSLDAVWSAAESPLDRTVRGAHPLGAPPPAPAPAGAAAPLVRIHSECFTGETVGSMRCDCGEQLDEALRLIARAPRGGAVVYLRQEGRGIGLLAKLRAYNLQDLGHDTVAANQLLGHPADARGYALAAAVLRDLGLAGGVRLLTNNPDKVRALHAEGVRIADRVPMVPRVWQHDREHEHEHEHDPARARAPGATLIGGGAVHGADLEKYMRTKVHRMGHLLALPSRPYQ